MRINFDGFESDGDKLRGLIERERKALFDIFNSASVNSMKEFITHCHQTRRGGPNPNISVEIDGMSAYVLSVCGILMVEEWTRIAAKEGQSDESVSDNG